MLSRRDFLKKCRDMSLVAFGTHIFWPQVAEGFVRLSSDKRPQVIFIQGQCCTGCSISLTYGNDADFIEFITKMIRLQVHPNLSFSQGSDYFDVMNKIVDEGNFVLVFEGTIPVEMKKACMMHDMPLYDFMKKVVSKASAIVASGTCSSHGGIPASNMNVTGAVPMDAYLEMINVSKPLIKVPGCPVQPDRIMGTVAYLVATGALPEMKNGKPKMYYGDLIHNNCGRYQAFNQDKYCEDYAQSKHECLLKKGCRGPITESDCPTRRWNGKTSVCVEANAPCIGCIHPDFPFQSSLYLSQKMFDEATWSQMKKLLGK